MPGYAVVFSVKCKLSHPYKIMTIPSDLCLLILTGKRMMLFHIRFSLVIAYEATPSRVFVSLLALPSPHTMDPSMLFS